MEFGDLMPLNVEIPLHGHVWPLIDLFSIKSIGVRVDSTVHWSDSLQESFIYYVCIQMRKRESIVYDILDITRKERAKVQ